MVGARVDKPAIHAPVDQPFARVGVVAHLAPDTILRPHAFDHPARALGDVEAGMRYERDEAPTFAQHTPNLADRPRGVGNVHQPHLTDDEVEGCICEHVELRRIRLEEFYAQLLLLLAGTATSDMLVREIYPGDLRSLSRQPTGVVSVAAGEVEHAQPGNVTQV